MSLVISWQEFKRRAGYHYYGLKTRECRNRSLPKTQGKPFIVGLLSSPNGIGQGARLIREGLNASGYDVSVLDLTPTIQPNLSILPVTSTSEDDGKGPIILHLNPSEVPKALHLLREHNLLNRHLIGVWAWELEEIPSSWHQCATYFDEIWSISEFSKKSFQSLATPAVNMGYPIEAAQHPITTNWKSKLDLEGKFCVMTAFDSRSSLSRKNPRGTIDAFQKAFSNNSNVALIVKVSGSLPEAERALLNAPNITLVEDSLTSEEMRDLIRSMDCYLSLTRAEGFGLVAAEAAINGIPTIITGWSAPSEWRTSPNVSLVDFTLIKADDAHAVYDRKKGRRWAGPNIEHAVMCLNEVYSKRFKKPDLEKISKWWHDRYGTSAFIARLSDETRSKMKRSSDS